MKEGTSSSQDREKEAQALLKDLGDMSGLFSHSKSDEDILDELLSRICLSMGFDMSILFHATNVVDDRMLILEVARIHDPQKTRKELKEGSKVSIDLLNPEGIYINEAKAFINRDISTGNVPGIGCDISGFVSIPSPMGKGYLCSGDHVVPVSTINDLQGTSFRVLCNLLSSAMMKNHFENMARTDALTGVANSGRIREQLDELLIKHNRQPNKVSSIVLADIDYFKNINDSYGHIQGDSVLEEFSSLISHNLREKFEIVGRYGGEEFLILLEDSGLEQASMIAERLRLATEEFNFTRIDKTGNESQDEFISVTASFGIASIDKGKSSSSKEILAEADTALYAAKEGGRNQVSLGD